MSLETPRTLPEQTATAAEHTTLPSQVPPIADKTLPEQASATAGEHVPFGGPTLLTQSIASFSPSGLAEAVTHVPDHVTLPTLLVPPAH